NINLVNAQQTRRILDRLVGYQISPLLWKKVKKGLSAGRVQSIAVKLINDRENEIQSFVPEEYWTIPVEFLKDKVSFSANFYGENGKKIELKSEEEALKIVSRLEKGTFFSVTEVVRKERKKFPAVPFTTSSLQQEAARKLNMKAKKTMLL